MKNVAAVLLLALCFCTLLYAHGNLTHVMGTVVGRTDHSVSVMTTDGSIKIVAYDAETHFLKGTSPVSAKDIVIGSRVVIHAHQNGDKLHAAEIKIGTAPVAPHP